jgi:hypothetical protein
MELNEEAYKCDNVVWDSNIVWTSFAKPWPYYAEKQAREPRAKIFSGCETGQRQGQRIRSQCEKMHHSFLADYTNSKVF